MTRQYERPRRGVATCPTCGSKKRRENVVCGACWARLPEQHKNALLNAHYVGANQFELAVRDAQVWLAADTMDKAHEKGNQA